MQLTDRRFFGLLGEIVDGNPTQEMLQAGFDAAGLPWTYVSVPVPARGFAAAWAAARVLGFSGLHVTKPFKLEAAALADRLTPEAAAIGAVNCVVREGDTLIGDNTDGRGLARAVAVMRPIEGARVAVLGAGGAARAGAVELALSGAQEVVVVGRTEAPARDLVAAVACGSGCRPGTSRGPARGPSRPAWTSWSTRRPPGCWTRTSGRRWTSARPTRAWSSPTSSSPGAPTGLLVDAAARGLATVHGNEMLVHQAAIGFERWTGLPADLAVLRAALAAALGG